MNHPVPANETIDEYRTRLLGVPRPFLLNRRFVSDESWTKATTQDGTRYLGMFREYEPDLTTILQHPLVLVLGEPGAGKSVTAQAAHWQVLDSVNGLPISAALKRYQGNLRDLLQKVCAPNSSRRQESRPLLPPRWPR